MSSQPKAYIVHSHEAETLVGSNGQITILAGAKQGSASFAFGTQQVDSGKAISVHQHKHADEAFYVLEGSGVAIIGEERHPLKRGDAAFVPRGIWHGFESQSDDFRFVWFIAPPGLDDYFRATRVPPGREIPAFTPAQMEQIGHAHDVRPR